MGEIVDLDIVKCMQLYNLQTSFFINTKMEDQ